MRLHVTTVTRHTGCTGFVNITLPAAPWDASARPWEGPQGRKSPKGPQTSPSTQAAILGLLRASGPMGARAIGAAVGRSERAARDALNVMLRRGQIARSTRTDTGGYLWRAAE